MKLAQHSFEYLSITTKRAGKHFKYGACYVKVIPWGIISHSVKYLFTFYPFGLRGIFFSFFFFLNRIYLLMRHTCLREAGYFQQFFKPKVHLPRLQNQTQLKQIKERTWETRLSIGLTFTATWWPRFVFEVIFLRLYACYVRFYFLCIL